MKPNNKGKNKNVFDLSIAELIDAGFLPAIVSIAAKKGEDGHTREFANVQFSGMKRGEKIHTTRNMPVGMVPRGLVAAYQASVHGNPCQRKKPGIRTRFM